MQININETTEVTKFSYKGFYGTSRNKKIGQPRVGLVVSECKTVAHFCGTEGMGFLNIAMKMQQVMKMRSYEDAAMKMQQYAPEDDHYFYVVQLRLTFDTSEPSQCRKSDIYTKHL